MHAVIIADFINNKKSIASVRQKRMLDAISKYYDVTLLTSESNKIGVNKENLIKKFLKKIGVIEKLRMKWGVYRSCRFPDGGELAYIKKAMSIKKEPDLIVVSFGPFSCLLCGLILKFKFPMSKVWIDYRDLYYKNPNYIGVPIVRIFEKWINHFANKSASLISTVSIGLARDITEKKIIPVVYNSSNITKINEVVVRENSQFHGRSLCYFGTYYSGYQYTGVVEYLKTKKEEIDCVILAGDCHELYEILKKEEGVRQLIKYYKYLNKEEMEIIRKNNPIEIYFSSGHIANGILSGKIFDYIDLRCDIIVSGEKIDQEVGMLLYKIQSVWYESGAYCVIDNVSRDTVRVYENFEEVINEYLN